MLKETQNSLFNELINEDEIISCNVFLFPWVITLFSQQLQLKAAAYLFDLVLAFGEHEIMRIALAICHACKAKLKSASDWQKVIRDCGVHLTDPKDLTKSIKQMHYKVSLDYIKALFKEPFV